MMMRNKLTSQLGLLVLALFVLSSSSEAAQHPSQDPAQSHSTGKPEGTGRPDRRGTDADPVVVKTIEGERTAERIGQDRAESSEKAALDRDLVRATYILAWVTVAAVVVAFGQLLMFFAQWRLMRRGAEDARVAANAARDSADVARTALTELERPWLVIEAFHVVLRHGQIDANMVNNWYISFVVRNMGRAPALIDRCAILIRDRDELPANPNYENLSSLNCKASIAAGETTETGQIGPSPEAARKDDGTARRLVVYGKVEYRELRGTAHVTAFAAEVSSVMPAASTYDNASYEFHT
jgi:hypothetical protein